MIDIGRTPDGRRRQKWHGGYPTRKQAEAARAELVHQLNTGRYVEVTNTTLAEWTTEGWLPAMRTQLKPSTWHSYNRNLTLHVLPSLGNTPLRHLTPGRLNTLYAGLLETGNHTRTGGLAAKTVRYIHTTIRKALSDAVDAGILATNPADRAKPPRIRPTPASELRTWTADQLAQFLDTTRKHRLAAAWRLAAMTGMRRGEILGLRWADVDLDAGRLAVRRTLISVAYRIQHSTPKTHQARTIDLDSQTITQLRNHQARQQAEREHWGIEYQDQGLVFARENGTPIHPDGFTQTFTNLVARIGLPRIRLHDLRHTHATLALQAGVPIKVVSERLGHQDPAFTLRQYTHAIPGMQAQAAAQIAQLVDARSLNESPPPTTP